ncbi:MAG: hypothetical protein OXM55_08630 [Bdellovibrionales bacterium]|nr:hypothetical protein [Bdellovibrionales bacterium]
MRSRTLIALPVLVGVAGFASQEVASFYDGTFRYVIDMLWLTGTWKKGKWTSGIWREGSWESEYEPPGAVDLSEFGDKYLGGPRSLEEELETTVPNLKDSSWLEERGLTVEELKKKVFAE